MSGYARRGIHGQTVEALAHRVLSGRLAEGDTLDLSALRAELGVSLTALRESLKVLAAKGMVDARQKRGTFVRPRADWHLLDADVLRWQFETAEPAPVTAGAGTGTGTGTGPAPDVGAAGQAQGAGTGLLHDLAEVRAIVEPAAVRLAAERRTDADLAALDDALAAMARASAAGEEAVEADLAFHRALLAASHNEMLERMEMVIATGLAHRDRLVHASGRHPADPVPSHRAVLDAVRARNPSAAESAMHALLTQSARDLDELRRGRDG